ncbi:MAG TPA: tetratricopeptide repeat protein, partial [Polyangiaceae bacterium]|nr:tetratricopeptide repeat protein [Polyangiaceae bacterium]
MKIRTVLLTMALSLGSSVAFADDAQLARSHFERGVALLDDSQFAQALVELEKSRSIRETAPVLFNLGLAYRGVGRYLEALDCFRQFLEVR